MGSDDRFSCFAGAARAGAFAAYGLDVRLVVTTPGATVDVLRDGAAEVVATDASTAVYAADIQPDLLVVAVYRARKTS